MAEDRLTDLLLRVGHVGELARLVSILGEQPGASLGPRELVVLVGRTAGAGHRYPRAISAIELAKEVGLIKATGGLLRLTHTGKQFFERRAATILDLSPFQAQLLLGLFMDDEEVNGKVSGLLGHLQQDEKGRLRVKSSMASVVGLAGAAQLLQQIGAFLYQDGMFELNQDFEWAFGEIITASAGLSEESLWTRLEAQRQRALEVEKRVLQEERRRLTQAGREDLAEAVFRISEINVAAGYDIESFEFDGSRRCIEVKSSTGRHIRFQWAMNERKQAEILGARYWIYFVPTAHALPADFCPVIMIRDPIGYIRAGAFSEKAYAFEVVEKTRTPVDMEIAFSMACSMAELPRRRLSSQKSNWGQSRIFLEPG